MLPEQKVKPKLTGVFLLQSSADVRAGGGSGSAAGGIHQLHRHHHQQQQQHLQRAAGTGAAGTGGGAAVGGYLWSPGQDVKWTLTVCCLTTETALILWMEWILRTCGALLPCPSLMASSVLFACAGHIVRSVGLGIKKAMPSLTPPHPSPLEEQQDISRVFRPSGVSVRT